MQFKPADPLEEGLVLVFVWVSQWQISALEPSYMFLNEGKVFLPGNVSLVDLLEGFGRSSLSFSCCAGDTTRGNGMLPACVSRAAATKWILKQFFPRFSGLTSSRQSIAGREIPHC